MELIFYDEAARIIGVTVGSLKHAVSRGELTRAGHQGHNQRLIREQVMLFEGRHISRKSLNPTDKEIWQRCANEASQGLPIETSGLDEEAIRRIVAEDYALRFREMLSGAKELYERGVPQGAFFEKHPVLAGITYALTLVVSLAPAIALFNELDHQQKLDVVAYLGLLDATLQAQERMEEPPISIEEIRERRKRIEQFKRKVKAA